jgi:hypothetical protein
MRIRDEILNTVAFLCVPVAGDSGQKWKYGGTGFFVGIENEINPKLQHPYFVTARHCVREAEKIGQLHIRMNRHDGKADPLPVSGPWMLPDDPSIDIAVIAAMPPRETFSYQWLGTALFLTDEQASKSGIGPGDELFMAGLFTARSGQQRNLPIVRTGIIAAMPDEPIFDEKTGQEFRSYVAEVRSIGGLSGSPVFVALEPGRVHPVTNKIDLRRKVFLLGVVRGHWDYAAKNSPMAFSDDELKAVNMGMAMITPIDELSKLLFLKDQVESRAKAAAKYALDEKPMKIAGLVDENAK